MLKIGRGTYSNVYVMKDKNVVKKIFFSGCNYYEGISQDAITEIAILKTFHHDNIINILYYDKNNFSYICLPLYPSTLKSFIVNGGYGLKDIKNISRQILLGVYHLHSYGICHQDIKPSNILIDKDYHVVLIDFGISRKVDPFASLKYEYICSLWYKPPEILFKKNYSLKVDIWSAGCILAEMLLGKPLFKGESKSDQILTIFKILGTPNDLPFEIEKHEPKFNIVFDNYDYAMADIIQDMLQIDPSERISSSDALNHIVFDHPDVINVEDKYVQNILESYHPPIHRCAVNSDISRENRNILMDWLFEIVYKYELNISTFIRCQNIIDRYIMEDKFIKLEIYQLIGITALWIAEKIEDSRIQKVHDLLWVANDSFTLYHILDMEKYIATTLDLNLMFPITTDFISYYNRNNVIRSEIEFLLCYIIFDIRLLIYHPSMLVRNIINIIENKKPKNLIDLNCMGDINRWISIGTEYNLEKNNFILKKYKDNNFLVKYK